MLQAPSPHERIEMGAAEARSQRTEGDFVSAALPALNRNIDAAVSKAFGTADDFAAIRGHRIVKCVRLIGNPKATDWNDLNVAFLLGHRVRGVKPRE